MRRISYQNRIALMYIVSTAVITGLVMFCIYISFIVKIDNYRDEILNENVEYYTSRAVLSDNRLKIVTDSADDAKIRQSVFVEIIDLFGQQVYKSENLKKHRLYRPAEKVPDIGSTVEIDHLTIGYKQTPLILDGKTEGYILTGIILNETEKIALILGDIFIFLYPTLLVILFFVARIVTKRSIKPIHDVIITSNTITQGNLSTRIPLPGTKDELYDLSLTINRLLDRIESAFEREKSFTSYASHEFRTPLATLKGTMEVLIRKPRKEEEYKEKIAFCINEVNRLNSLVENLLLLSRYEDQCRSLNKKNVLFEDILTGSLGSFSEDIKEKGLSVKTSLESGIIMQTDEFILSTILSNLLSNAIKYAFRQSAVEIKSYKTNNTLVCNIQNQGEIIPENELPYIFDKFYRAQTSNSNTLQGFGLGLSIVKYFCDLLDFEIVIDSKGNTTQVCLHIPLK